MNIKAKAASHMVKSPHPHQLMVHMAAKNGRASSYFLNAIVFRSLDNHFVRHFIYILFY